MNNEEINIIGLQRLYPDNKYTTKDLIDILGNKLTDTVKENIFQLGVDERYFTRPIESYLKNQSNKIRSQNDVEPISDLSVVAANKCLSKLGLNPDDITCLVAAYEDNDYLSPGLSSIVATKMGLSKFVPHFNIQGMACSTLPKVLELGKNLVHKDSDKVLVVISGCNSGWYLPHLGDGLSVLNPHEISSKQYDREEQIRKWVATMFSFLFGDGVAAFVLTKEDLGHKAIKIGKIVHGINFEDSDYRKACVRIVGSKTNPFYEYELTAASDILKKSLEYSKKVLMKFFGKENGTLEQKLAESYMSELDRVMIHTGSTKILDGFKNHYNLKDGQIQASYETLGEYGNLTGVSLPTVMDKALMDNNLTNGKGLLIGITMGFGLDLVEVETTS